MPIGLGIVPRRAGEVDQLGGVADQLEHLVGSALDSAADRGGAPAGRTRSPTSRRPRRPPAPRARRARCPHRAGHRSARGEPWPARSRRRCSGACGRQRGARAVAVHEVPVHSGRERSSGWGVRSATSSWSAARSPGAGRAMWCDAGRGRSPGRPPSSDRAAASGSADPLAEAREAVDQACGDHLADRDQSSGSSNHSAPVMTMRLVGRSMCSQAASALDIRWEGLIGPG